jgi:hypothetical protein
VDGEDESLGSGEQATPFVNESSKGCSSAGVGTMGVNVGTCEMAGVLEETNAWVISRMCLGIC